MRRGLVVLGAVILLATLWYWVVEDFQIMDALFQTVITVSTVGFHEVQPLDRSGQVSTIVVIAAGVGAAGLTLSGLFEDVVSEQLNRIGRRRMEHRIEKLRNHAVVCGYGRVGAEVAELLRAEGEVLVIDGQPDRAALADDAGFAVILGDSTDDDVLAGAGLERARVLVTALPTDADNLYVVLSGRSLNPGLRIVARAQSPRSEAKLVRAGADRVVVPEDIGARRMVTFATRPSVADFLDVVTTGRVEYRLEEVRLAAGSPLAGRTLAAAAIPDRTGALVLGISRVDGPFVTNPQGDEPLSPGAVLIAIGTPEQLTRLEALASPGAGRPAST